MPPSTSDSSPKPIPPGRTSPGSVGGTFERLLVRFALADGERWVLKGGAAVEVRMADRARTTKDIDLAARHTDGTDADVREALVDVLLSDPQGDFFEFRLDKFRAMGIHGAMGPVGIARPRDSSTPAQRLPLTCTAGRSTTSWSTWSCGLPRSNEPN